MEARPQNCRKENALKNRMRTEATSTDHLSHEARVQTLHHSYRCVCDDKPDER